MFFCVSGQWHEIISSGSLILLGLAWGASYAILVNVLLADVPQVLSGVAGGAQIMGRLLCGGLATALMTSVLVNTMNHEYWHQLNTKEMSEKLITPKQADELKRLKNLKEQLTKQRIFLRESKKRKMEISQFNVFLREIKKDIVFAVRASMGVTFVFALFAFFSALKLRRLHKKQESGRV